MPIDPQVTQSIEDAVRRAFSAGVNDGRYIDISRIPLICQSIISIDESLKQVVTQDQFWPIKTLVYGFVGIIMTGVVGAILMLLIK